MPFHVLSHNTALGSGIPPGSGTVLYSGTALYFGMPPGSGNALYSDTAPYHPVVHVCPFGGPQGGSVAAWVDPAVAVAVDGWPAPEEPSEEGLGVECSLANLITVIGVLMCDHKFSRVLHMREKMKYNFDIEELKKSVSSF